MAEDGSVLEKDLSKVLSSEEKEERRNVCQEKDVTLGCKNSGETNSKNSYLNEKGGLENPTMKSNVGNSKQEKTNLDFGDSNKASFEAKDADNDDFKDCSTAEFNSNNVNRSDNVEKHFNSMTSRFIPERTALDEVLMEEDETQLSEDDKEENYESAEEEHLTSEEAEERKKEAMDFKTKGNEHFRKQEFVEGKDFYTQAIKKCPKEFPENKSIFYANRAACSQKMEEYENAISDCSKALELSPNYNKARLRRALCYEKVEKLEEALEDYKTVFENDKSCQTAREAILRLPEEIKIKHEKLKEEMIGKLKDLGNMVLRPFGLSTNNFNLQQDPNTGGYSINFQK